MAKMGAPTVSKGIRRVPTQGSDAAPGPARTPDPPYWAVIFTSVRNRQPDDKFDETDEQMMALAARQPGFLGVETAASDIGITVSYWADEESIANWRRNADHEFAQYEGRTRWLDAYELRVARVERAQSFTRVGT